MLDLTVGIPIYNSAITLEQTISSVANQSILPREVIMIDDASRDDSYAVARRILAGEPIANARLYSNEANLGIAGTYNRLISLAQSKWIQILDADDYLAPGYYSRVAETLSSPATTVVTGMRPVPRRSVVDALISTATLCVPFHPPLCFPLLGSVATRSGVIYRTECLRDYPFADPFFDGSDILHLLHLRMTGVCSFIPQAKVFYRLHAAAISAQASYSRYRCELRKLGKLAPFYYADMLCRKKLFGCTRKMRRSDDNY